jgi:hypothetical protein
MHFKRARASEGHAVGRMGTAIHAKKFDCSQVSQEPKHERASELTHHHTYHERHKFAELACTNAFEHEVKGMQ